MVRPTITTTKHYVQFSLATILGGAVSVLEMSNAVNVVNKNQVFEVEEGSLVKAVYVEIWARAGDTVGASGQMVIFKQPGGQPNPTTANMAALGDWSNKKNIFYTTMGLFNDQDADAIALFKGWIKIPKGKQRQGLEDSLKIAIFTPTIDLHICGFCLYKEYT